MSAEQLQPGTLLNDRYRILSVIGKGGMGTVYKAEHVRLDTILAVKEVRAPQTSDADAQMMLEQCQHEARFLVKLHHPNLPQVTDAFVEDDRFFVVMEYIEGVTLEAKARLAAPGGPSVASVIDWGLQIADVLAYLHSQDPPIIFRDLKPANVMVERDGRIRLIDFGIARRFQPGAVKDTNLLGSVGYSPPEQFGRHQTDTRTDIYAFGATLHNLLTGNDPSHTPFKFASAQTLNPAVPDVLSRLIDCCLRLDAEARPQNIHEVAMELLALRDTLPPAALLEQPATVAQEPAPSGPASSGARIILTNPTLRDAGKTQRGSQRTDSKQIGSAGLVSDRLRQAGGTGGPPSGGPSSNGYAGAATSLHTTGPEARDRRMLRAAWIGSIVAVAAIGGLAAWILNSTARHPRPGAHIPAPIAQTTAVPAHTTDPPLTPAHPVTTSGPASAAPSDSGSVPIVSPSRTVTFDTVAVKGVAMDVSGHSSLRIEVTGIAEGQAGDQEIIAAFFYDSQNNQMVSQMPQTPYSSKDGKLSVAATIMLTAIRQPFILSLDLPLTAFPTELTGGLQFHCVAFYGDQRIGESKTYTPVSTELLMPRAGSQPNTGDPPPNSGNGTPMSPAPNRPGTFGTHRGGEND